MSSDYAERFAGLPREANGGGLSIVVARTRSAKRRGLARLDTMPDDHALHILACRAVHTFGMRFALDLIWLRADGSAARIDRDVAPGRMRLCLHARSVIEANAGRADAFLAARGSGERD